MILVLQVTCGCSFPESIYGECFSIVMKIYYMFGNLIMGRNIFFFSKSFQKIDLFFQNKTESNMYLWNKMREIEHGNMEILLYNF